VPTTLPSTGGGETSTGTDTGGDTETLPANPSGDDKADQPTVDQPIVDKPIVDQPVAEVPGGQVGDESGQGSDPVTEVVKEVVKDVLPVLPTPTGAPTEEPARLEQYFGKDFTGNGKHSSGKPALGWAKSQYAKGKHSTGHYAEGKHAAVTRAHGSMAPVTIRQILGVLNTPMSDR
jgi:hypothetical protein